MKVFRFIVQALFALCLLSVVFGQTSVRPIQAVLSISSGGAGVVSTIGPDGNLQTGYTVVTIDSGSTPYATAVFSYTQNGIVVSEVGVPASPPTLSARLFIDFRTNVAAGSGTVNVDTGIAVVNMGTATANIMLLLRDLQGNTISAGTTQLAVNGHWAKFIDQLDPDFGLPRDFSSAVGFGSLEVTSDQPISILALRLTNNQRHDPLLTSTPVADMSSSLVTTSLDFPQIADGGGYQTTLLLMNTSKSQESGTINFMDDDGLPLEVRLVGGGTAASQFSYQIPPDGALRLVTDGSPSNIKTGWAQVVPTAGSTPVGAGVFGYIVGGILVTESGVPAVVPTTQARIYVDMTNGHDTGLAVINPSGATETLTLTALSTNGQTLSTANLNAAPVTITLPANCHEARFVDQLISSGLPQNFTGILDISSSSPFAALTLRSLSNTRGDVILTTFPTADLNSFAPAPIIFPQIAAGSGYQTEFIFISTGSVANATLGYRGNDGLPLAVGEGTTEATNYTQSGGTVTKSGQTYFSAITDTSGVYVTSAGTFTLTDSIITTSGNSTSTDNSSKVGLNAGVLANSASKIALSRCSVTTTGSGANGIFATGTGSSAFLSNGTISATGGNAHGVDVTYGASITLTNVNINTTGGSGAALATDFGGGTVTATGGTMITSGFRSPGIYSTGNVTVFGATITATGSEAAVIEGSNTINLTDTILSGEQSCGVMIYNSGSGDAQGGTGTFTMNGGSFTASVGALFYITNTTAVINVTGVNLTATSGTLVKASTGNWGTKGGTVTFNAVGQTMTGNMDIDSSSSIAAKLQNNSSLTGYINSANTAKTMDLTLDSSSSWNVTANSYLSSLTDASGVSGTSITNITGNGFKVYYDKSLSTNSYLGGLTYSLVNGGQLLPK